MKYAKLVDDRLIIAPNKIEHLIGDESFTTHNPDGELLMSLGWLPLYFTEPPDDAPEGSHYESSYSEEDDRIVQEWTLVEDPMPPDPDEEELSAEEALSIILGGDPDET